MLLLLSLSCVAGSVTIGSILVPIGINELVVFLRSFWHFATVSACQKQLVLDVVEDIRRMGATDDVIYETRTCMPKFIPDNAQGVSEYGSKSDLEKPMGLH